MFFPLNYKLLHFCDLIAAASSKERAGKGDSYSSSAESNEFIGNTDVFEDHSFIQAK